MMIGNSGRPQLYAVTAIMGRRRMSFKTLMLASSATAMIAAGTSAETLRWTRAGDALTLDPHSQNEGPTSAMALNPKT